MLKLDYPQPQRCDRCKPNKPMLKIKKLNNDAKLPEYAHEGDSGLDLFSAEISCIEPGENKLIKTGTAIELPPGTEAQIRPKSGLASKYMITVLNAPGTIDEGYRGEILVNLINHSHTCFKISKGMKIAQMVICPVIRVEIEEVNNLGETARGQDGHGSTGN